MLTRSCLVLVAFLFAISFVVAQQSYAILSQVLNIPADSTVVYLHNGCQVPFAISRVLDRAVIDTSGGGVSLRIIDSIRTTDSSVASQLSGKIQHASLHKDENGYLVDLSTKVLPPYEENPMSADNLFHPRTCSYIYYPSTSHRIGVQLDGTVCSVTHLILQVDGTAGLAANHAPFSDLNYSVGAGYEWTSGLLAFKAVLGYGMFVEERTQKGDMQESSVIFFSPNVQMRPEKDTWYYLTCGGTILLSRSVPHVPGDQVSVYFGIGLQL